MPMDTSVNQERARKATVGVVVAVLVAACGSEGAGRSDFSLPDAGPPADSTDAGPEFGANQDLLAVSGTVIGLAADDANLYWIAYSGEPASGVEYSLNAAAIAGGNSRALAKMGLGTGSLMEAVAVHDGTAYWIEGWPNNRYVRSIPGAGGTAQLLASTQAYFTDPLIAADDGLWFAGMTIIGDGLESDGVVYRMPFAGGKPKLVAWGENAAHLPWSFALMKDTVVFTIGDGNAYLAPRTGNEARATTVKIAGPVTYAAANADAAWVVTGNGKGRAFIVRILVNGDALTVYSTEEDGEIGGIAANDRYLFWTELGTIRAMPVDGGTAATVVSGDEIAEDFATLHATGDWLYWCRNKPDEPAQERPIHRMFAR